MLTHTLRVTQKHVFRPPKINTPFIYHESFSPKFSYAKKKYGAMLKKRETYEALKIVKEKKKKNGTHEGSKVLKKER